MPPVRSPLRVADRFSPTKVLPEVLSGGALSKVFSAVKNVLTKGRLFSVDDEYVIDLQRQSPPWPKLPGAFPDLARPRYLEGKYFGKWRTKVESIKRRREQEFELKRKLKEKRQTRLAKKYFWEWVHAVDEKKLRRRIKQRKQIKYSANEEDLPPQCIRKKHGRTSIRDMRGTKVRFTTEPDQIIVYEKESDEELRYIEITGDRKGVDYDDNKRDDDGELDVNTQKFADWWKWKYEQFAKTRDVHQRAMREHRKDRREPYDRKLKELV